MDDHGNRVNLGELRRKANAAMFSVGNEKEKEVQYILVENKSD